jgi:threonyl-tRNA synthetase
MENEPKELDQSNELYRIRHSLAHVMAAAVLELRPGSKLGFGPPIEDGFYYDFILSSPITDQDFEEIEKRMRKFLKEGFKFYKEELEHDAAMKRLEEMGEPYKREYAEELFKKKHLKNLSFFRTGPFLDMCDGPHVGTTKEIPRDAFKIRSTSGAYWRGDQKNQQMTRIYAWAFRTKEELDKHVEAFKLAQERDHKKLGKELDIFVIDDEIGKGLPLWMPNGTVVREELEKFMKELEFKAGYQRVATPHLAKEQLYFRTGHLPYYAEGMYPSMELKEKRETATGEEEYVKEAYRLRPMNCPHHHKIFAARLRSYRDLPLRLAEFGQVYRFEESGGLSGILRVRGMCQNDAHIYCTEEQIKGEFLAVVDMVKKVYETLGITDYHMRFSTWDPEDPKGKEKFLNDPKAWEFAQGKILEAIRESGLKYVEGKGEAAFYGPKLDFQFRTVTGREETASTSQLDFGIAARLGLEYKGADNLPHHPYIIHRAPLGTHERFIAFMIEHFGGAFPTWLAPVQAMFIPVGEHFAEYCHKLAAGLRQKLVRAEVDDSSETLNKRLRNAVTQKIPNMLVIGEREVQNQTVTLRRYGKQEQQTMPAAQFEEWLLGQIRSRALQ